MANILPAQSAEFEGAGTGNWSAWFGCSVAKSTAQANSGTGSLQITATDSTLGLELNNWPGWAVPGAVGVEHEAQLAMFGPPATFTFTFEWRTDAASTLGSFQVPVTTDGVGWVTAEPVLSTAPVGTTRLFATMFCSNPGGGTFYLDTVVVDNEPAGGGQDESGGSTASTSAAATGGGVPDLASGGAAAVTVTTVGQGTTGVTGSGQTAVQASVAGAGSPSASDGSTIGMTYTVTGNGSPGGSGGSVATITVGAVGDTSTRASGGSTSLVVITPGGVGTFEVASGSTALVRPAPIGAGSPSFENGADTAITVTGGDGSTPPQIDISVTVAASRTITPAEAAGSRTQWEVAMASDISPVVAATRVRGVADVAGSRDRERVEVGANRTNNSVADNRVNRGE